MAAINLTQDEADSLLALQKQQEGNDLFDFPALGGKITVPIESTDGKEKFLLDVSRSQLNLQKTTHQHRGRRVIVLARLDLGGSPHRNPDGEEIDCPHLHVYREGYGDKWAMPIPRDRFTSTEDSWLTFEQFCAFINLTTVPSVSRGLFT